MRSIMATPLGASSTCRLTCRDNSEIGDDIPTAFFREEAFTNRKHHLHVFVAARAMNNLLHVVIQRMKPALRSASGMVLICASVKTDEEAGEEFCLGASELRSDSNYSESEK
jgi:hypothetical protein